MEIDEELRFHREQLEAAGALYRLQGAQDLPEVTLDLLILRTLTAGAMHGWGVAERIRQVSDGTLSVDDTLLYPALHRLEQQGWISAAWRGRARYYGLTVAGRQRLRFDVGWSDVVARAWGRARVALASARRRLAPSRLMRGALPKRVADVLAPELELPAQEALARLQAPERRRGESYWGARPAPGLPHKLLDAMKPRVSHAGLRPSKHDREGPARPATRPRRARVASLTETAAGKRALRAVLVALALALVGGAWLDPRATLLWVVTPAAAYLAADALLSFSIWVQINSRRRPEALPAERKRTLTPHLLRARHAALFFVHKLNYLFHLFRTFLYLLFLRNRWVGRASDEEIADHCVELLIGSSYAIFLTQPAEHAGTTLFVLDLQRQAISQEIGKFDNRLLVVVDAAARRILRFEWNGADVPRNSLRLQLLCDVGSQSVHPMIHSFNTLLYDDVDRVDRSYDRIFRHGQNLNNAAHHYPALCLLCPPRWFKVVLETNAAVAIPLHTADTLRLLEPHSPYVRFMLEARGAYLRLVEKHAVGVNVEAFFICSALHSVDHAVYGSVQDRVDFPGAGNNLVYRWFHLPLSVDLFMDNTLSGNRDETPFYGELYDALRSIDPEYAEMIDLSISN